MPTDTQDGEEDSPTPGGPRSAGRIDLNLETGFPAVENRRGLRRAMDQKNWYEVIPGWGKIFIQFGFAGVVVLAFGAMFNAQSGQTKVLLASQMAQAERQETRITDMLKAAEARAEAAERRAESQRQEFRSEAKESRIAAMAAERNAAEAREEAKDLKVKLVEVVASLNSTRTTMEAATAAINRATEQMNNGARSIQRVTEAIPKPAAPPPDESIAPECRIHAWGTT